ncbi:MAG: hypothetical protein EA377_13245 [Phycisphaerales bacterium]|nr:MAG: hypothetical protein EA377_13245 [Phycisphaerales bacterium]
MSHSTDSFRPSRTPRSPRAPQCRRLTAALLTGLVGLLLTTGCARQQYFPERAAAAYPHELHAASSVDIQVFRDETNIELVNATATTYRDFKLWVNQRYVKDIDRLAAGETRRFSLWDFYDERGEVMNAGGFFRFFAPDPVRLVQIQVDDESPLIGLIAIPAEPLEERDRTR